MLVSKYSAVQLCLMPKLQVPRIWEVADERVARLCNARGTEILTAETPQDPGSFVTLLIQSRRPERLAPNLVRQPVDRSAELISPSPDLVKALLASGLRLVPRRQYGGNFLHCEWG